MGPSQHQLRLLSREDRIIYKEWLRRSLMVYGTALTLLVLAAAANHILTSPSPDVAGDTMHTAAITAKK
jgi:hypothetical protein